MQARRHSLTHNHDNVDLPKYNIHNIGLHTKKKEYTYMHVYTRISN